MQLITKRARAAAGSTAIAEPIELGHLTSFLGYHLRRAQLAAFERFATAVQPIDVNPVEFSVMLLIEANPGIKQTTLARFLAVERSTMVRLVDRLVGIDLVKRGTSTDRRSAPPELTPLGRATLSGLVPKVRHAESLLASRLSAAERDTLLHLLRTFNGDR